MTMRVHILTHYTHYTHTHYTHTHTTHTLTALSLPLSVSQMLTLRRLALRKRCKLGTLALDENELLRLVNLFKLNGKLFLEDVEKMATDNQRKHSAHTGHDDGDGDDQYSSNNHQHNMAISYGKDELPMDTT